MLPHVIGKYKSTKGRKVRSVEGRDSVVHKTQIKCSEPRKNINTVLKVLRVKTELLGSSVLKKDESRKETLNTS